MGERKQNIDYVLYYLTIILVVFGIVMVYSSSSFTSELKNNDQFYFAKRQALWALIGFCVMNIAMFFRYRKLKVFAKVILFLAVFFLLLVLIPGLGEDAFGARRWLSLGPFRFQPSEFAKLASIIFIAAYLDVNGKNIRNFKKGLLPVLLTLAFIFGLILLQRDFGTAFVILLTGFSLFFIAGIRFSHLIPMIIGGGIVSVAAVVTKSYRFKRLMTALNPWEDPLGSGYQTIQSLYALAAGGIFGVGLGNSVQKRLYLPFAHTDFIFSIISEELGFLGASVVVAAFLLFAIRGITIARNAPDIFGSLLAAGLTFAIIMQAFINILVVTATLPVTGITLPFISSGGSSLLITMASVGILLNISRYSTKESR